MVYFKDIYSSYIENDEDFTLEEIDNNFTDDERQEISSLAAKFESFCEKYIRNDETDTSKKRNDSNIGFAKKDLKLSNTEDYTSYELEIQEFDSVVTIQPCNDKMIEDNPINPISGSDIEYLEGITNDKGELSVYIVSL